MDKLRNVAPKILKPRILSTSQPRLSIVRIIDFLVYIEESGWGFKYINTIQSAEGTDRKKCKSNASKKKSSVREDIGNGGSDISNYTLWINIVKHYLMWLPVGQLK